MTVLAIDLGGTRVKAGLVDSSALTAGSTHDAPPDAGAESLAALLGRIKAGLPPGTPQVEAAALCVPGLVDERGIVVSLPGKHAGIEGVDLPQLLREAFATGRSLVVNDAIAYAAGEAIAGAGADFDRVVVVTIGTGVGVTVMDRRAPVTQGVLGGGILGGFIPISERTDGPSDSIGRSDTIEAFCAAQRIADACGTATVEDAYAAWARNDDRARAGVSTYQAHLARALTALASAHAPSCIVLGGGPMSPGNPITPGLEEMINDRLFGTYRVQIRPAALGDTAALIGLASLAAGK